MPFRLSPLSLDRETERLIQVTEFPPVLPSLPSPEKSLPSALKQTRPPCLRTYHSLYCTALQCFQKTAKHCNRVRGGAMDVLVIGLVLFLGAHVFVTLRGPRAAVIVRIGESSYKGVIGLV